jgi:hypothetical protein
MQGHTLLNGAAVNAGGYWTDRDGHLLYLCEGQFLPSCPRQPFQNTFWSLQTEIPCPDRGNSN